MKTQSEKENCPVRKTAEIIGKKWTTLIIRDLLTGSKSFSQLERSIGTISPKVLAERLKFLETKKIIKRKVFPTNPPTTEYRLTILGEKMNPLIQTMASFGQNL